MDQKNKITQSFYKNKHGNEVCQNRKEIASSKLTLTLLYMIAGGNRISHLSEEIVIIIVTMHSNITHYG